MKSTTYENIIDKTVKDPSGIRLFHSSVYLLILSLAIEITDLNKIPIEYILYSVDINEYFILN